jgi:uncharacterized protein YjdB
MFDRSCLGALLLAGLVLPLAGCGSSNEIDSITITPATQSLAVGAHAQFTAIGTIDHGSHPASTENITDTATWASSSTSVATVSSSGVVTAVGAGSATITASTPGYNGTVSGTATVTVTGGTGGGGSSEPITAVTLIPSSQSVASPTETGQFIALGTSGSSGLDVDITNQVSWSSSDTTVATVSKGGLVTGSAVGSSTITALYKNPDATVVTGTAVFTVSGTSVVPGNLISLQIVPGNQAVAAPGGYAQYVAIGTFSGNPLVTRDMTNLVAWSASEPEVATVSPSGLATGLAEGATAILAIGTNPDGSVVTTTATFTVTGSSASVGVLTSIAISPSSQTVSTAGQTAQFVAIGTYSGNPTTTRDLTNEVTWISSSTAVGTVNSSGLATAKGAGTTAITAVGKSPDGSAVTGAATFTVTGSAAGSGVLTSLAITPTSQTVGVTGETAQFIAIGTYSGTPTTTRDLTNQVTWISAEPSVGTISSSGLATGTGVGTTAITAIAKNADGTVVTGAATFTVSASSVASGVLTAVSIIPNAQTVAVTGDQAQFIAIGTYSGSPTTSRDLTNQVTWVSGQPSVGTINSSGLATGTGVGTTAITAIAKNADGTVVTGAATFTVTGASVTPGILTTLTITPSAQTVPVPGATAQFIAIGTYSGTPNTTKDLTNQVTWISSQAAVGTINSSGLATGVGAGTTTITAEAKASNGTVVTGAATFTVTGVSSEPLLSMSIIPTSQSVATPGQTGQFIAIGTYAASPVTRDITSLVTWSSSAIQVATISNAAGSNGLATAVGPGTTAITAIGKNPDGSVVTGSATFTVTGSTIVEPLLSLTISPASQAVAMPGQTGQFIAIGTYSVAPYTRDLTTSVTWISSQPEVATISNTAGSNGLATGVSQGATAITAEAKNPDGTLVTASAAFTVTGAVTEPLLSIAIIPASQTVSIPGEQAQFIAIGTYSGNPSLTKDITNSVTWVSSDVKVGTISNTAGTNGLATGVNVGTTAITAIGTNPDGSVVTGAATFTVTGSTSEPLIGISIIPNSQSVAGPGVQGQFIAIGTYSGNPTTTKNITNNVVWSSSVPSVATIDASTGLATAVNQGTTAITAIGTNPDGTVVTGTATFTVTGSATEPLLAVTIIPASQTVSTPGETGQFIAIGTYSGNPGLTKDITTQVKWISSDTTVGIVSNAAGTNGLATGLDVGTTAITAEATNPDGSVVIGGATFTVTGIAQEPLQSISIIPNAQAVAGTNQTGQFVAIGTYSSAPFTRNLTDTVTWSSSTIAVATISNAAGSQGLATAVGPGVTGITAIASNPDGSLVTATGTFTVTGTATEPLLSITIIPASQSVSSLNETSQFIALGTFSTNPTIRDLTDQVTWLTSDATVGTVSPTGLATAHGTGSTAITAYTKNPDGTVVTGAATFSVNGGGAPQYAALTVDLVGQTAADGTVTADDPNTTTQVIDCTVAGGAAGCSATFPVGSTVTLTATPTSPAKFSGWSANCTPTAALNPTGPNSCKVTLPDVATVSAIFN